MIQENLTRVFVTVIGTIDIETKYNEQCNIGSLSFVCVRVYIYMIHSDLRVTAGTAVLAASPVCRESWSTCLVKQIAVKLGFF